MKIFILALLAITCRAGGQTFVNYHLTATVTNIVVPTNTLLKIVSLSHPPSENDGCDVNYTALPNKYHYALGFTGTGLPSVLGPASITFYPGDRVVLAELDVVNVQPSTGFAVQPAASGATIALETSTNLTTWDTATNGNYDGTQAARFFRLNLQMNP